MNKIKHIIAVSLVATATAMAATDRPNVIIVLTDDQGYGDIGAHGHPFLKTPNMDKLYAESVRFTDFHVAPMCSPTRPASRRSLSCASSLLNKRPSPL